MSNLRLKDHTWDAANVYDSSLGKTQGQINTEVGTSLAGKQGMLVSGENIKTVNGASILGSGNIEIQGGGGSSVVVDDTLSSAGAAADAKKTGDEIGGVKTALEQSLHHIARIPSQWWEQGAISISTGADSTASQGYRCRTQTRMEFPNVIGAVTVKGPENFWVSWRKYTETTYEGASDDWMAMPATFTADEGYKYRFVIKKTVDGSEVEFTPADFSRYAITFEYDTADDNQSIITRNNPPEMDEKLQQLTRKTRTGSDTYGRKPLCFIHFSDVHGDLRCLQNVVEFRNHYADYIDDAIHTGDTMRSSSSSGLRFWSELPGAEKILNVIGNHDTNVIGNSWIGLTMQQSYDQYFAPFIANWNVNSEAGKTYYYKDYSSEKVRLIVLDAMHQTEDQLSWFSSVLSDANTNGFHVVCFLHIRTSWKLNPYDTAWDDSPNRSGYPINFVDSSSNFTGYPTNLAQAYVDAVNTFITAGGNFVCWMHGHTHYKIFATITDHPNQLDIAVGNAGEDPFADNYVQERTGITKTMDNFNVVAIDTTAKLLRICKVGVSYDRLMRKCDTICWDYGNSTLLFPHDKHGIEITEQPSDISGAVGSTATLKVVAVGEGLRYQWQIQRPGETDYTDASSPEAKSAEWEITLTSNTNGRKYRCAITNAHGQKLASSEALVTTT